MAFQIPFKRHSRASLIKALVLFMTSSSSWPNHPKAQASNAMMLGINFQYVNCRGEDTSIQMATPSLDAQLLRCSAPFHCQTSRKSCRHFHFPTLIHPWAMPSLPVHLTFHVAKSSHFSALVLFCFCSIQPCWPVFPAWDAFLACHLEHHAPLVFLLLFFLTLSSFIRSFFWRTFAGLLCLTNKCGWSVSGNLFLYSF